MSGSVDGLFSLLVFVTVFLTAFAIGLTLSLHSFRQAVRRRAFALALAVNLICVPVLAAVVVWLFDLETGAATGILLCAAVSAGPMSLKASQIARSDLTWALTLSATLLSLNVIALPFWSSLLVGQSLTLRPADLGSVLIGAILVPVALGLWLRAARPRGVDMWSSRATAVSNVTLVLAVAVGALADVDELSGAVSTWSVAAAVTVVGAAGVAGWAIPDCIPRRRSTSLTTLNRATSVALLVVAHSLSDQTGVFGTVVVFGTVQTLGAMTVSCYWRWRRATTAGLTDSAPGLAR